MKYSIEELRALRAGSTKLEYIHCDYHHQVHIGGCAIAKEVKPADLTYVAAACNALPDLLDILEEARELILALGAYGDEAKCLPSSLERAARAFLDKLKKETT